MPFNPTKTIKNSFIDFIRYFYDPNLQYLSHLRRKWVKSLIPKFLDVIFTGVWTYGFLFGIVWIFPKSSNYIFLGTNYWQVLLIIFFLGLITWYFEDRYEYIRGGYKK
ncbi:hypothetical protein LCGC14_2441540 [marine sediment metagenome]|uniref:Uncharacterized protein n=1 Tax=marine sediment metagenome TaxID=412755 RepID=A0A0F9ECU1_9ZZZZ